MMDSAADSRSEELMRQAEAFWAAKGSRMTLVRRILCRCIFAAEDAFDAEELLRRARAEDKMISLSTVYRTLGALVESGLLVEVEGRDGEKNYNVADQGANASSHVVCEDCGQVIPLNNPCLALRESPTARAAGFQPSKINLRFEARCDELKKTGRCQNREDKHA